MTHRQSLTEANQVVLNAIASSDGPITMGLLPLKEKEQADCIKATLDWCDGDLEKLLNLMRISTPAVACYSVATCASQAVKSGGDFWGAFTKKIRIELDTNNRKKLSLVYKDSIKRLGVIEPDISDLAWNIIAPIMAQASILHAWAGGLAQGLRSALGESLPPDLEDPRALKAFSDNLAKCIRGHANLSKILKTEVGAIVTHRIISGYVHDRYEILPPHLVKPMKEAFANSAGSGMMLKSPYVSYSNDLDELELVLPKLSSKLTTERTCWVVDGRQYSVQSEQRIYESDLHQRDIKIELINLKGDFQNQEFQVKLGMSSPFRIFNQQAMREKTFTPESNITLPPGEYTVVMPLNATTNDSDVEEITERYRVLSDVILRPGTHPLEITLDGVVYSLNSALKAGIYNTSEQSDFITIHAKREMLKLHYGENFGLEAYIPKDQHKGKLSVVISSSSNKLWEEDTELQSQEEGVYDYSSHLERALSEVVTELSPGIHFLQITIGTSAASAVRKLWYWKGLQRISNELGFICDILPQNINYGKSKGIRKGQQGCGFPKNFHAPEIRLTLQDEDSTVLSIPRPGIQATCFDPSDGWEEDLHPHMTLPVNSQDNRIVRFNTGGFLDWELCCNGKTLAKLTKNKTNYSVHLRSLTAQFGNSGRVTAHAEDGQSLSLFSFASSLIATHLRFKADHVELAEKWTTSIPTEELGVLGIECHDFSDSPAGVKSPVINLSNSLQLSENSDEYIHIPISEGVTVKIKLKSATKVKPERLKTVIMIKPEQTKGQLLQINLVHMPTDTDQWIPILCQEKFNASQLSILSCYTPEKPSDDISWWGHLRSVKDRKLSPEDEGKYCSVSAKEITSSLHTLSYFISTKYPTDVFNYSAKYQLALPFKLAQRRLKCGERDYNQWWEAATTELEKHAQSQNAPIVRTFLFGCNLPMLTQCWLPSKKEESNHPNNIFNSLTLLSNVHSFGGQVLYTQNHYHQETHPKNLYEAFDNFSHVLQGKVSQFKGFSFNKFLNMSMEKALNHVENYTSLDQAPVLSARHLLAAIKNLNRRSRVLAQASMEGDSTHVLNAPLQALTRTHAALRLHIHQINQSIHYVPETRLSQTFHHQDQAETLNYPDLPTIDTPQAKQLADLTWALCVATRATAHGKMSPEAFSKLVKAFAGTTPNQRPLNLILTFAPELFAYYTALLDFALYTHPSQ